MATDHQIQTLTIVGQPLGSMVATGKNDPLGRPEKEWRGLEDYYQCGPDDNYRLGARFSPQGPDGPTFVKERVTDPVTSLPILAWRHEKGVPARGCGGLL